MLNININDARRYKNILRELFFCVFREIGLPNNEKNIHIFYSLVDFSIRVQESTTFGYSIHFLYNVNSWIITRSAYSTYKLDNSISKITKLKNRFNINNFFGDNECKKIINFIREVLFNLIHQTIPVANQFFCISRYSFIGKRYFEESFKTRIFDAEEPQVFCPWFYKKMEKKKFYVIIKKECLIFIEDFDKQRIKYLFLFDANMQIRSKNSIVGKEVFISDLKKNIVIKSKHKNSIDEFISVLERVYSESNHKPDNRYHSFAPIRNQTPVEFLVDGKKYFSNLYKAISAAKTRIFIAGWWVYPKVYLKRVLKDGKPDKRYRLDSVLKEKAKMGVNIYILLYREYELALPNNSAYTEQVLKSLHKNIQIIRHPYVFDEGFIYWSHHEKIVIVDDQIGYVGGIDICLGRFDSSSHILFDKKAPKEEEKAYQKVNEGKIKDKKALFFEEGSKNCESEYWPGNDFSNPLKKDFFNIGIDNKERIDRKFTPRMPWHDVHCKVGGFGAIDLSRHFIERWNFSVFKNQTLELDFIIPNDETKIEKIQNWKSSGNAQILRSIGQWSNRYVVEKSIYLAYADLISNAKNYIYIENQFFITNCTLTGDCPENDLGKIIIKRLIRARNDRESFKIYVIVPLLPAFEAELNSTNSSIQEIIRIQNESISRNRYSLFNQLIGYEIDGDEHVVFLSLRNACFEENRVVTELIYVHSKIIIADMDRCIIGSANFNDRSMCGDRDSEVAILVENNSIFVEGLQRRLLEEHLGLKYPQNYSDLGEGAEKEINSNIVEVFKNGKWKELESRFMFNLIKKRASLNTKLFKEVFRAIPDDEIQNKEDLKRYSEIMSVVDSNVDFNVLKKISQRIKGHLVLYPKDFFRNEKTQGSVFSISGYIPSKIYY